MSLINIENISAGYTKKDTIVDNISFKINEGELVGILGANGSGKSTLVKAICNILSHTGTVDIDGVIIEKQRVTDIADIISYIPQRSGISIDISVLDVVMMGFNSRLKFWQKPDKAMREKAKDSLLMLGLNDKADTNYMLLSEGQKQLVVLARALVSEGKLLVMDEPESALDFNVRYNIMRIIKNWIKNGKRAGLIILHDTMLALNNCDRLILLKDKQIVDIIDVHADTIESMETKLSKVYGKINLVKNISNSGKESIIMVCDSQ